MTGSILVVPYSNMEALGKKGWNMFIGTSEVPTNPPVAFMGHVVLTSNILFNPNTKSDWVRTPNTAESYAYVFSGRLKQAIHNYVLVHTPLPVANNRNKTLSDELRTRSWGWWDDVGMKELPAYMTHDLLPILIRNDRRHIYYEKEIDDICQLLVDDELFDYYQLKVDIMKETNSNEWIQKYSRR